MVKLNVTSKEIALLDELDLTESKGMNYVIFLGTETSVAILRVILENLVTYNGSRYGIEIKRWHGNETYETYFDKIIYSNTYIILKGFNNIIMYQRSSISLLMSKLTKESSSNCYLFSYYANEMFSYDKLKFSVQIIDYDKDEILIRSSSKDMMRKEKDRILSKGLKWSKWKYLTNILTNSSWISYYQ